MKKFEQIHNEIGISPLTQSINFGYQSREMGKLLGIKPFGFICAYYEDKVTMYNDLNHWKKGGDLVISKAKNNIKFFEKLLADSEKIKKETLKIIHKIGNPKKINYSNKEIIKLIEKLSRNGFEMTVLSQLGAVADHYHNSFSDLLEKTLSNAKNLNKSELSKNEIFNLLTTSPLKLPSEIAKNELFLSKDIDYYLNRWHWLHFGHLGPSLTKKDAKNLLKSKPSSFKNLAKKQKEIENLIFTRQFEKNLFQVSRIFVYLKGSRMEICNGIFSFLSLVLDKVSKETKYDKKYLYFLSIPELINYFKSEEILSEKILKDRYNYSVWEMLDYKDYKEIKIDANEIGKNIIKNRTIAEKFKINNTKFIKGSVAYSGIVRGMVKIINSPDEMSKIKEGDIMVSVQTMPELLPAMRKASAFITDMGGIISHAAIVSRELKKPCVVGTRNATKILKDGDMVEVNANEGIVKII